MTITMRATVPILALLLTGLGVELSAQVGGPKVLDPKLPPLLQKLRNPRLDRYSRDDVVAQVLAMGEKGARALYSFSRSEYRRRHQAFKKSFDYHLNAFGVAAGKVLRGRLDKATKAKVEELQAKARRLSGQSGLSKQTIKTQIDPIVTELDQLLTISVADVLKAQPKLAKASAALQGQLDRLYDSWDLVTRASDELTSTPKGKKHVARQKPLPSADGYARELKTKREWSTIMARPMSERDGKLLLRNAELRAQIQPEEYAGILDLNLLRLKLGRSVMAIDVKLCKAARDHSTDMRKLKFFSHTSPVPGKESPGKRAALAGTSGGAENIARGASTGKGSIRQWWYSPGHHRNMMRGGGRIGLGRDQRFWTQMFGG